MAYAPHTAEEISAMLAEIGIDSVDELFASIPQGVRLHDGLDLPAGISEAELRRRMTKRAAANTGADQLLCFAGAGSYEHDIPSIVKHLALRSEFATAYTPYQAEVSQGTLQVIYEFQSYISRLTSLPVSNASLYDGATAMVEAALLAAAHTRRSRVLIPQTLLSAYGHVLRTYADGWSLSIEAVDAQASGRMDLDRLDSMLDDQVACLIVAQPNGLGVLEDTGSIGARLADEKTLLIGLVQPTTLSMISPPGEWNADIAVGEGQSLGIPMSFGGPQLGFMATRDELKRRLPGRLVGETQDVDGKRGFVLTLQTREQHIRREKATSNICTNQGLVATMATIYLSTLGRRGLSQVAEACFANAHYLADQLASIEGVSLPYSAPFFREFVLRTPMPANELVDRMASRGILAGVPLRRAVEMGEEEDLLVAVSELRDKGELDGYARALAEVLGKQAPQLAPTGREG